MRVLMAVLFLVSLATAANGATLRVPSEYPTIQAAVDAAADFGDVILVDTGEYLEDVLIVEKDVGLVSEHGMTETTVSSLTYDSGCYPCVISGSVVGFRILDGLNASEVDSFHLEDCETLGPVGISGTLPGVGPITIVSCIIRSGLGVGHRDGVDMSDCDCFGSIGLGSYSFDVSMSRCNVTDGSVWLGGQFCSLGSCTFENTSVEISAEWAAGAGANSLASGNLNVNVSGGFPGGALVSYNSIRSGGIYVAADAMNSVDAYSNTVYGSTGDGIRIIAAPEGTLSVHHNIVAMCDRGVILNNAPESVDIRCNDIWLNSAGNWIGIEDPTGSDGNINLDPRFCEPGAGNLLVASDSPCLPGNPENHDCGQVGAFGEGCSEPSAAPDGEHGTSALDAEGTILTFPNPYRAGDRIRLGASLRSAHSARGTTVTIYDCLGRRIRLLWCDPSGGHNDLAWDGRNDHGFDVETGVYQIEARIGPRRVSRKILLLQR